jgi:hypothetical protein
MVRSINPKQRLKRNGYIVLPSDLGFRARLVRILDLARSNLNILVDDAAIGEVHCNSLLEEVNTNNE